ncbi:MAG: transposase [Oligoflexia bacterium]|nr:transposase [Oligoflexia bacterium]
MILGESLPFIEDFLESVNEGLNSIDKTLPLSHLQKRFLAFCLMGILVTNSICWSKFFRASLGQYPIKALSWMFRRSKMFWDKFIFVGITLILEKYGVNSGVLILDDTDRPRSKNTSRVFKVHKIFDKKTGGYFRGQCIVFLVLVTNKITIPVGFRFYHPDPVLSQREKDDEKLKKAGIPKKERPPCPERNPQYPSKAQLAQDLVKKFNGCFPKFDVKSVIADAFYCSGEFIGGVQKTYPKTQIISQLKKNQLIHHQGKIISVEEYFRRHPGVEQTISIRGQAPVKVCMCGARLKVDSHSKKRFVVALKYEGEDEYRYIVASDLCWRMNDIVQTYTLRWLVEVFIEDWKNYEGWRELKLQYVEGSERAVILSLLLDYSLLLHQFQQGLIENNLPACTVGSLIRRCKVDAFVQFILNILEMEEPEKFLKNIESGVKEIYQLQPSEKHMNSRDLGRMEPTPHLKYKAKVRKTELETEEIPLAA